MARRQDAYERLVASLASEETQGIFRQRSENRERAARLVGATIGYFLQTLDPSLATAVADFRAEERHGEVLDRFDASASFEQRLVMIPPAAREILEQEHDARALAEHVLDAIVRGDPHTVIESLVRSPPDWLEEAPAVIHLALAQAAQAYGLRVDAAREFKRAADLGLDRPLLYARAAFERSAAEQADRAEELMQEARSAGVHPHLDLIEAAIQNDGQRMLATLDRDVAAGDPFTAGIYAAALRQAGKDEEAIAFLSGVTEAYPQYTGMSLQLASLLLRRSTRSGTTSRSSDLDRALELSLQSRDIRRQWRGDSSEAVDLACRAALVSRDYRRVVHLGTPEPDGLALPAEASNPEVQVSVTQAAIAAGDIATLRAVATTAVGFHQALINAVLLVSANGDQTEIDEHFKNAWELVTSEDEQIAFWLSASESGVEPLPGENELDQRTDDLPILVRGSQHLSRGRFTEAIELLRPHRGSESVRQLLTDAYQRNHQLDDAVAELADMADRFDNPRHLVGAVELLARADRLAEAAEFADPALRMLPSGRSERDFLHEVGIAAANRRNAWPDMETRVRSWIDERGPDQHRRWLLVYALLNQADLAAAWRVSQEDKRLEPEIAHEAEMWIALYARQMPGHETLSRILRLCERFPDDPGIRAAAINAFLLMRVDEEEISPEELARWQQLLKQRAESPAPGDTFVSISLPDDPDDMIETFRPILEPQARQMEEWLGKVRKDGWPYGTLAIVTGRAYTSALVQRAAGILPIASPDREVVESEFEVALAALDRPVVGDMSVLVTAWFVKEYWQQFVAAFTRVELTAESRRDAAVAAESMNAGSSGTLGWDLKAGRPVFHEMEPKERDHLEAHLSWVQDQATSLSLTPTTPDTDDRATDGAWMTSIVAARAGGVTLWADDVGLRTLARNEGVPTFSTHALVRALESRERLSGGDVAAIVEALRDAYCVDFRPDREWLIRSARNDHWSPGPALVTFTRPATWAFDLAVAFDVWQEIAHLTGSSDPMKLGPWVYAASMGIVGTIPPPQSVHLVASIVAVAMDATASDPTAFAACLAAATEALKAEGLPDPVERALEMAFERLTQRVGRSQAATAMAQLGSELSGDHKQALRWILFGV